MKLHYMGKFNLDPDSLPQAEHKPGAVEFKEADSMKKLSVIANTVACIILVILGAAAFFRIVPVAEPKSATITWFAALLGSIVIIFPHELLHALCFKKDVYLYTNLKQGMLFVIGTETMSKFRFVFMSALPNVVFGVVPYILGMIFPNLVWLLSFGILAVGMGAGDYYNIFNALTQMPKGARTYLYQFNSYWYIP